MYFEHKDYVRESQDYQDMVESLKLETKEFMEDFHDDSRLISGWGHGYFCNEDGGRLIYDRKKPFEHQCSICGRIYRQYQYNACHVTMMRNEAVVTAVKCGLLYQITGDEKYAADVERIISFYSEHYEEFAVHAKDKISCTPTEDVGGAGKIMPQGLNEAIILIRMVNAMELVKEKLDKQWLKEIEENLFSPAIHLLLPQKNHIHNIPTWINSAIGVAGFFFHRQDWVREATEQPFHLMEQLDKGVTESGFWYEGSIHYNFFALEGVMNFLVFAEVYGYEVRDKYKKTVLHMLDKAYHYAFDNDIFPNPSDGWPDISLKTYAHVYYMGYKALGEAVLPYLLHIEKNPAKRTRLPLSEPYYFRNRIPLERLLFLPNIGNAKAELPPKRCSANFEASNCTILRNETYNVFFKYGHQTKSHAHPDKMNIEVMVNDQVLTKDLSNSGYASRMCNQWHRKIAAHNTCVVNGSPTDITHGGQVISFSEDCIEAKALAYEGVWYQRKLMLDGSRLYDEFIVDSSGFADNAGAVDDINNCDTKEILDIKPDFVKISHTTDGMEAENGKGQQENCIDWFFHFEIPVERQGLKFEAVKTVIFEEYGEDYIQNLVVLKSDTDFEMSTTTDIKTTIAAGTDIGKGIDTDTNIGTNIDTGIDTQILILENELVRMKIWIPKGSTAYLAKTFNNPADKLRDTVIIRKMGKKMAVKTIIEAKDR